MLARRLIPCLDVAGGRVVKGVHFRELRDAGDPVDQAARYDAAGAAEVVLLDIGASARERGGGGGAAGADRGRSTRGAGAALPPAAGRPGGWGGRGGGGAGGGSGRKGGGGRGEGWEVMVRGGREPTGLEAVEWVVRLQEL